MITNRAVVSIIVFATSVTLLQSCGSSQAKTTHEQEKKTDQSLAIKSTTPQPMWRLAMKEFPGEMISSSQRNLNEVKAGIGLCRIGSNTIQIIHSKNHLHKGVFSPSGDRIAFSAYSDGEMGKLFITDRNMQEWNEYNVERKTVDIQWVGHDKILCVPSSLYHKEDYDLFVLNTTTNESEKLYSLQYPYVVVSARVSSDEKKIALEVMPRLLARGTNHVVIIDLVSKKAIKHNLSFLIAGWKPNEDKLIVSANHIADGKSFNDRYGVIAEYDVNSRKFDVIKEAEGVYGFLNLSRDGKYLYYEKNVKVGGSAIFIQEVYGKREWQLTECEYLNNKFGYTEDSPQDWYYEGDIEEIMNRNPSVDIIANRKELTEDELAKDAVFVLP